MTMRCRVTSTTATPRVPVPPHPRHARAYVQEVEARVQIRVVFPLAAQMNVPSKGWSVVCFE